MTTQEFKGAIPGGTLSARFQSDPSNADSDLLVMAYSEMGGADSQVDQAISAPGGSATVQVNTEDAGILEVWVAIGNPADSGRLTVSRNGEALDDDEITGSVRWVYAVDPA